MIKIGIVGTGGMAAQRARVFHEMNDSSVAAVCSRTLEKTGALCEATGARGCDDYETLLDEADAVVVCLPNRLHAQYALKALERGRHVLVEYPLCISRDEVSALRAAAGEAGRVLMVGNTIIHEAMFQHLTKHRGRLGTLVSASSRVALYATDVARMWYMNPEYIGSPFPSLHYHHIEYYRRFLGEVAWVMANDESRPNPDRPGWLSMVGGTVAMGHEGGAMSCIQWYLSASGDGLPRGLWLNGISGSVTVLSQEKDKSHFVWDAGGEGNVEVCDDEWGVPGSCADFVQAVSGTLDHRARLDSDIKTLEVGFAATESSRKGELVRLK